MLGCILISLLAGVPVVGEPSITLSPLSSSTNLDKQGRTELVDKVDVSKLPKPKTPQTGVGEIKPLFVPDPATHQQAKANASDPKHRPPAKPTWNDSGDKGTEFVAERPQPQFVREAEVRSLASPQPVSVSLGSLVIDGLDDSQCSCTPPDVQVAVGPNHIFEMVNIAGRIFTKAGAIASSFSLASFFSTGTDRLSDPQLHYDALSGRWFASILDVTTSSIRLAVSASSDPTGTWFVYNISAGSNCPDQPWLGVSNDHVVLSANDFTGTGGTCTSPYVGAQYWVLSKSQLISGSASPSVSTQTPDPTRSSIRPVRSLSSTSTLFMVSAGSGSTSSVRLFSVIGVPPGMVTVSSVIISIRATASPPDAPQSGSTRLVETNDARIVSAVWQSNTLWFALNDACIPSGDTATRACLRLVQLNTATSTVIQDFDFAAIGDYYFYPALSMDSASNLVIVFGRSNASIFPELRTTGRAVGDPVNTLQASVLVSSGTGPNPPSPITIRRYGDYFGAATDPSNPAVVWIAGQVGTAEPRRWITKITSATIAFDFSVSNSGGITVTQGGSGSNTITATLTSGSSQSVSLSCTAGLPSGASCSFSPASGSPTFTSSLTVSTMASTPTGSFTTIVAGTGGVVSRTTSFALTVNPAPFDFSLSNSGGVGMIQGGSGSTTITVTLTNGATQSVSLTCSGLPSGTSCNFNSLSGNPTFSSTLTISTANPSTPPATYTITVTGTGGGLSRTTSFALTVNPAPFDFSLSNSGGVGMIQGGSGSTTITVTLTSGVTQNASLSCIGGLPAGASCSFSPASGSPTFSSTLTITTTVSTPKGSYTITATGTGGGLSRSTSFNLTVTGPPTQLMLLVMGQTSVGRGGAATFDVLVINPGSALTTILYIDVLGPGGYEYFDTARISVAGGASTPFQFTWQVPSGLSPGSYQVTIGFIPPRPTAVGQTQITVT